MGFWFLILLLLLLIAWLGALLQLLKRTDLDGTTKICWVVVLCTLSVLGLILYGVFGPKRSKPEPFRKLFEPRQASSETDDHKPLA